MIINRQSRIPAASRGLAKFLARVEKLLRVPAGSTTVCLVSDAQIEKWNRAYRGRSKPTDVLSFPAEVLFDRNGAARNGHHSHSARSSSRRDGLYLGDIAIAPAVARRNARRFGRAFHDEMRILILHGVLHLLGHDHEADSGEMERLESELRRRLGLS